MLAATSPSVGVNCSVAILIAVEDAISSLCLHVKLLFQLMVGSAAKGSSMQSYSH
jgi:hypothetical protein